MANLSNINGKFVVEQTTGYVGVGTTDPNFLIEAAGANSEIALNSTSASIYRVRSTSSDAFIITKNGVGDRLVIAGNGNATFAGNITFGDSHFIGDDADDNLLIQSSANENIIINSVDDLFLRTGGTTKLIVKNGGNVGIGTTSPGAKLEVKTSGTNTTVELDNSDTNYTLIQYNAQGATKGFSGFNAGFMLFGGESGTTTRLQSGGSYAATILENGNFGIGTTSPGAQLHNYSTAATNVFITGHGTAAQNDWGAQNCMFVKTDNGLLISKANAANNTNRIFNFYNDNNGYAQLYMHAGATAFVKIQANGDSYFNGGNVGIGSTNPTSISANTNSLTVGSSRNDLSGAIVCQANGTTKSQIYWDSAGLQTVVNSGDARWYTGGVNDRLRITSGGNVGIGESSPAEKLEVNGNIKAKDVDGKIYSMVASWSYVASKNDLFSFAGTEGAVWEYTIRMNPNTAGSGAYRDFYYGKLGIGIGWNGSNVTQYMWQQQDQTAPRTLYSSGGGNFNPLFRMYYSGGIYTELALNTAWTLRIQGLSTTTYGDIFFRRLA